MQVGNTVARVNGAAVNIPAPEMIEDRVMVPLRFIGEAMGARVDWDDSEQKVTYSLKNTSIELWVGRPEVRINGEAVTMDVAPLLLNDTSFVPLRFVSENLGAEVRWDSASQSATITCGLEGQLPAIQPGPGTPSPSPSPAPGKTVPGAFTILGKMSIARSSHTATLLPNGKVLFTGGDISKGDLKGTELYGLKDAELYDPATGTTSVFQMNEGRAGHTATLLSNGTVLIVGYAGFMKASAELYDLSTESFKYIGSNKYTSDTKAMRSSHTATLLQDGKVLLAGGWYSPGSAEVYDPNKGEFTYTKSLMNAYRYGHTATLLSNGKVLIAGGYDPNGGKSYSLSSAELYDPAKGTFTATGSMNNPRGYHAATLLPDGKVLITGGLDMAGGFEGRNSLNNAELYDPATGQFISTKGQMKYARSSHTATLLPNGKVLITGGSKYPAAEIFDPATGTFSGSDTMKDGYEGYHTATTLTDGKILIAGGTVGNNEVGTVEIYDCKATAPAPEENITKPETPQQPQKPVKDQDPEKQTGKGMLWCNKYDRPTKVGYANYQNYTGSLYVEGTTSEEKPFKNVLTVVSPEGPLSMELPYGKYRAQYQANYVAKDNYGNFTTVRVPLQLIEFTINKDNTEYSWEPKRW